MTKWHGKIGFSTQEEYDYENHPGDYREVVVEKPYYGEIQTLTKRWQTGTSVNDNLNLTATLSVLMNDYIIEHLGEVTYITWYGHKWKVESVQPSYPRMTINIGGIYNG